MLTRGSQLFKPALLLLCDLLKMLVFNFSANAILLCVNSLLDSRSDALLQSLQLRLVIVTRLFKSLGEGAGLGLLVADGLA